MENPNTEFTIFFLNQKSLKHGTLFVYFILFFFWGGGIIWLTKSNKSDTSSSFFLTAKAVQLFIVLSAETHSLNTRCHS